MMIARMLDLPPLDAEPEVAPALEVVGRQESLPSDPTTVHYSFSRQTSAGSDCSLEQGEGGGRLPPRLPFVGFMRHAPAQQLLSGQLDRLLRRRCPREAEDEAEDFCDTADDLKDGKPAALPRASPYVGSQRHAPPSPSLSFSSTAVPLLPPLPTLPEACFDNSQQAPHQWPGLLPEEVWTAVLGFSVDLPSLSRFSRVGRGFPELLASRSVWEGRPVCVPPGLLRGLAPRLDSCLTTWQACSRLIIPRSTQLLKEISIRAPGLRVEVAWRFDQHMKGDGVEIHKHGLTARRTSDDELVVLGDAALTTPDGKAPFLEVSLDERGESIGDDLNDFGFGVTACDPEEIGELGAVADEVPRSWVVDFTKASVVLSVNNHEAAKGMRVTSDDLQQGDRVGIRLVPGAVEVFINGVMRERLVPNAEDSVPLDAGLYPVIDLYGRTVQVSRTEAEEPRPDRGQRR